jgi:drug/metabolite transporter (DMT)-like permease
MKTDLTKAYLALAVVSIVWGTTYYALLIGVKTFPPFLFSGLRQAIAGILLSLFLLVSGKLSKLSWKDVLHLSIPGVLMISMGNGIIGWSERYIPSGLAALIASIMPVYIVLLSYISGVDRKKINSSVSIGLLLGTTGVVLIFRDNIKDLANARYLTGMIVAFLACVAWACGSIYAKYKPVRVSALTTAAVQMTSGGLALILGSFFLDDLNELHVITTESIFALLYLIVAGSLLAYTCFVYALEKLPVGLVSIYAYINPFIALLLGAVLLDERLTGITIMALLATLSGVYFINRGYRKPH